MNCQMCGERNPEFGFTEITGYDWDSDDEMATGVGPDLRDNWIGWQNAGYQYAKRFGKVAVCTIDGTGKSIWETEE